MKTDQDVLELLIANEKKLALLYMRYSELFPNHDFWLGLSKDEEEHAALLQMLGENFKFENNLSSLSADLKHFTQSVEKDYSEASVTTSSEALKRAIYYEETIIDKNAFEIFASGQPPEILKVIERIKDETTGHRNSLIREKNKLKN